MSRVSRNLARFIRTARRLGGRAARRVFHGELLIRELEIFSSQFTTSSPVVLQARTEQRRIGEHINVMADQVCKSCLMPYLTQRNRLQQALASRQWFAVQTRGKKSLECINLRRIAQRNSAHASEEAVFSAAGAAVNYYTGFWPRVVARSDWQILTHMFLQSQKSRRKM